MQNDTLYARQIITGFKTVVLGLCLYIVEFLSLPIYGFFQKLQVNGNGFYSNFVEYARKQPYTWIFSITGVLVILGIVFMICGVRGHKQSNRRNPDNGQKDRP